MLTSILTWILNWVLGYLASLATKEVAKQLDQMAKDKERDGINEKNIKDYESAKDRHSRIAAATRLLNGEP